MIEKRQLEEIFDAILKESSVNENAASIPPVSNTIATDEEVKEGLAFILKKHHRAFEELAK